MAKPMFAFYDFAAGINKRDVQLAINELIDAENVFWQGKSLERRKGYGKRSNTLSGYSTGNTVLNILGYHYYLWGTAKTFFLFASIDAGGGSVADKLIVLYNANGLPTSAVSFTALGSAYAIPWDTSKPFSIQQKFDKVYIAVGLDDPYVLYYDSAWKTKELIVCERNNAGADNGWAGGHIIDNYGTGDSWQGGYWVTACENILYYSDKKLMYLALCASAGDDPAKNITGTAGEQRTGIQSSWSPLFYKPIDDLSDIFRAESFKSYVILGGRQGVWKWYNKEFTVNDYLPEKISDFGCRSNICVTPVGVFWVGTDGMYYFDGVSTESVGLKFWDYVRTQHSNMTTALENVTLTYHKGWVYVSFPNSTSKEVWVFNPQSIYTGEDGRLYAPVYKSIYRITNLSTTKGFKNLKSIQDRLYATDGTVLYELDSGYKDNAGTAQLGINTNWQSAYIDLDSPNVKKIYGAAYFEMLANIEDTLAHTITFYRDYGEESSAVTGIDTTYSAGVRAHIDMGVPYTVDGNALSVKVTGNASAKTGSDAVRYYGFGVEALIKSKPKIEES